MPPEKERASLGEKSEAGSIVGDLLGGGVEIHDTAAVTEQEASTWIRSWEV